MIGVGRAKALRYFEYNSTISCSCTGRLICSRVGSEATRPDSAFGSNDNTRECRGPSLFDRVLNRRRVAARLAKVMTSPTRTEYDGTSTFLPLTRSDRGERASRLRPRRRQAKPIGDVVQPARAVQQRFAGDAALTPQLTQSTAGTDPRDAVDTLHFCFSRSCTP